MFWGSLSSSHAGVTNYAAYLGMSHGPEQHCGNLSAMAANATTLIHYSCSVCTKGFGDSHKRCLQHVHAKGSCGAKGAKVMKDTIIIGRNDRNVGGRLAQPHQLNMCEGDAGNHD